MVATVEITGKPISPREEEVLALIVQGMSNKQIAEALNPVVTVRTAESHVANLLLKTGYANRTELAVWASKQKVGSVVPQTLE